MTYHLTSALPRDYAFLAAAKSVAGFGSPNARRTAAYERLFYCPTLYKQFMDGASRESRDSQDLALSSNLLVAVHPHLEVRVRLNRFARRNAMSKSKRASAQSVSPSLKCRPGDLAIYIAGISAGRIVEVIKYVGAIALSDGSFMTQAWQVQHPDHHPNGTYYQEDRIMLPIRPGDLEEGETDELSLEGRAA